jgi:hypothetical protein
VERGVDGDGEKIEYIKIFLHNIDLDRGEYLQEIDSPQSILNSLLISDVRLILVKSVDVFRG